MPRPVLESGAARKLGAALTTYSKKRPPTAAESERIADAVIEAAVGLISRELLADAVMKRCANDPTAPPPKATPPHCCVAMCTESRRMDGCECACDDCWLINCGFEKPGAEPREPVVPS